MQSLAENWLVLSLTASAFYLGLDAFLQQLPIMLFTLIGGVVADRHDRRLTLMASQWVQLSTAAILAALVYLRGRRGLAHPAALLHYRHGAGVWRTGVPVADSLARRQTGSDQRDRA